MIDYWFSGEGRIRTSIQLFSNIICDETVNLDYSYERITIQPTLPICILPHLLILGAPSPTVRTLCGVNYVVDQVFVDPKGIEPSTLSLQGRNASHWNMRAQKNSKKNWKIFFTEGFEPSCPMGVGFQDQCVYHFHEVNLSMTIELIEMAQLKCAFYFFFFKIIFIALITLPFSSTNS